jgi:WD40 repeat protein
MIQFDGHSAPIFSLGFCPNSSLLASGGNDGWVRVWEASGAMLQGVCPNDTLARSAVAWMPSGEWVTFADDNQVQSLGPFSTTGRKRSEPRASFSQDRVVALTYVTTNLLAVGTGKRNDTGSGQLHLWDVDRNRAVPVPLNVRGANGVRAIAAHPPTKWLHWIAGLQNSTACIWRSWCITSTSPTDVTLGKPAAAIAVSPDGGTVALAIDWQVKLFTAGGKSIGELSGHKGRVSSVTFGNGGRTVVSAGWDETVRFWDVKTLKETARFPLTIGQVTALAISPDNTRIAVGGTAGPIVVIDAE